MTDTLQLVPMTEAHLDGVMPYEDSMFGPEAWSRSAYREELRDHRTRYYLAAIDGAESQSSQLIAWGGVRVIGDEGEILTVGVIPDERRRGVARQLLTALLAEAARRGAREVFLEVRVDNLAAIHLYKTSGFTELGLRRGYYDGGRVDALTMRLELPELPEPAATSSATDAVPGGGK